MRVLLPASGSHLAAIAALCALASPLPGAPAKVNNMPEIIVNGSCEQISGWEFQGTQINDPFQKVAHYSGQFYRSGITSIRLAARIAASHGTRHVFFFEDYGTASQPLAYVPGKTYNPSFWFLQNGGATGSRPIDLSIDPGDGVAAFVQSTPIGPSGGWQQLVSDPFIALGPVGRIALAINRAYGPPVGTVIEEAFIDDISVTGPITEFAMLEQIRANLIVKLQQINGISPWILAPTVTEKRQLVSKYASLPVICLRPNRLASEDVGTPFKELQRYAWFDAFFFAKDEDDTPDVLISACRDIARAVESDQTLGGLGYVADHDGRAVVMEAWDPVEISPEVGRGYVSSKATIRVGYMTLQGEI
jgi:hypothetical protein